MKRPNVLLPALAAALLYLLAGTIAAGAPAAAHGNPQIAVTPNPASAASTVTIKGTEFDENEEVSLVLEGVSGDVALGTARTDAEGSFHVEVALPGTAGAGSYRIRAESSDASAIADFRITVGAGGAQSAEHGTAIGFHAGGPTREVIGLSAALAVLAILGFGLLLWRERPAP